MKNYIFKITKTGQVLHLLARNNREAMKLIGIFSRHFGEISWLKDDKENFIIKNKHTSF